MSAAPALTLERAADDRPLRRSGRRAARGMARGHAAADGRAGRDPRRARRADARRVPAARGHASRRFFIAGDHVEPVGRQFAPTWMGAIGALTEGTLGVRMQAARRPAASASIEAGRVPRGWRSPSQSVHRRVMQQVAPVMSRITAIEQNRERLASLGTMAAGLAHELNNPGRGGRPGRRADGGGRRRRRLDAAAASSSPGSSARMPPSSSRCTRRRSSAPRAAPRWTRSMPPTPRMRCSSGSRRSACPSRGASPSRSRPPASTRTGSSSVAALAGPATDAALGVGRGDAHGAQPRGRAAGGDAADVEPRRRRQVVRLHGSRRRWSRSTSTKVSRRR